MSELLEAERRVAEWNAIIEHQRQPIEELAFEGRDIASAQIVFDSLLVSLSLHVQNRQRLRTMLNVKAASAQRRVIKSSDRISKRSRRGGLSVG
jgi:hypothetical protein